MKSIRKIATQTIVQYIVLMNAISYSDLRKNLKKYLDEVYSGHYPLIITRKNDENLVMLSLEEYNSLQETQYLLSNSANARHLEESVDQHRQRRFAGTFEPE